MTTILGVKLSNKKELSPVFQELLAEFGCYIKTRIGLNSVQKNICSPVGIILLEILNEEQAKLLEMKLCSIENIEIQKMEFRNEI